MSTSRRDFFKNTSIVSLGLGLQSFTQNANANTSENSSNFSVSFDMDEELHLIMIYQSNDQIVKNYVLAPGQVLDNQFTYTEKHTLFFIPIESEIGIQFSIVICFVHIENYVPVYTFIQLNLENEEVTFKFRGQLSLTTQLSNGEKILRNFDEIRNIFPSQDPNVSSFCDMSCLVYNARDGLTKIITLNKGTNENHFSTFPVVGVEDFHLTLFNVNAPLFKNKNHIFLTNEYGKSLNFYSFDFLPEEKVFQASLVCNIDHNQKITENWAFQYPSFSHVEYFGNDFDTIYCPLKYAATPSLSAYSLILRKKDTSFAAMNFVTLDDRGGQPEVLATSKQYSLDEHYFFGVLSSSQTDLMMMCDKNINYFFLSLQPNKKNTFSFTETPFPVLELIDKKIVLTTENSENHNAWLKLKNFFSKTRFIEKDESWTFRSQSPSFAGSQNNQFLIQLTITNEVAQKNLFYDFFISYFSEKNEVDIELAHNYSLDYSFLNRHQPQKPTLTGKKNNEKKEAEMVVVATEHLQRGLWMTPSHLNPENPFHSWAGAANDAEWNHYCPIFDNNLDKHSFVNGEGVYEFSHAGCTTTTSLVNAIIPAMLRTNAAHIVTSSLVSDIMSLPYGIPAASVNGGESNKIIVLSMQSTIINFSTGGGAGPKTYSQEFMKLSCYSAFTYRIILKKRGFIPELAREILSFMASAHLADCRVQIVPGVIVDLFQSREKRPIITTVLSASRQIVFTFVNLLVSHSDHAVFGPTCSNSIILQLDSLQNSLANPDLPPHAKDYLNAFLSLQKIIPNLEIILSNGLQAYQRMISHTLLQLPNTIDEHGEPLCYPPIDGDMVRLHAFRSQALCENFSHLMKVLNQVRI